MTTLNTDGAELAKAVLWAIKGTPAKSGDNSTGDRSVVKLSLDKSRLNLFSFDGEDSYSASIDVRRGGDEAEYENFANESFLMPLARTLKSGEARVELKPEKMLINTARSNYTVPFSPSATIPKPHRAPAVLGKMLVSEFKKAVNQVTPAASNDETIPAITSIYMNFDPQQQTIHLVATDRHQLSSTLVPFDVNSSRRNDEAFSLLIRARTLKKALSGLNNDETLTLGASESTKGLLLATSWQNTILGQLEAKYAAFAKLLALPFSSTLFIDRAELKATVSEVAPFNDAGVQASVTFSIQQDSTIVVKSPYAQTVVDASGYSGEKMDIAFDPKYLVSALNSAETGQIAIKFNAPNKPVVFKNFSQDTGVSNDFTYLVMPRFNV